MIGESLLQGSKGHAQVFLSVGAVEAEGYSEPAAKHFPGETEERAKQVQDEVGHVFAGERVGVSKSSSKQIDRFEMMYPLAQVTNMVFVSVVAIE